MAEHIHEATINWDESKAEDRQWQAGRVHKRTPGIIGKGGPCAQIESVLDAARLKVSRSKGHKAHESVGGSSGIVSAWEVWLADKRRRSPMKSIISARAAQATNHLICVSLIASTSNRQPTACQSTTRFNNNKIHQQSNARQPAWS